MKTLRKRLWIYNHSGGSVKDLSSEYGVSEVTIYKWIKDLTPVGSGEEALTQKELVEMQKEMLRLKQENEILKKAMAIFAKQVKDTELTTWIDKHKDTYPVAAMCEALAIPRSTYYQLLHHVESHRDRENKS